jgi:hypothetical protein
VFPAKFAQARHQALREVAQVKDIVGGVFQLFGTQGSLRPIRPGLTLGDGDVQQRLDQFRVSNLRLEPDAARRDLRIEHRRNHPLGGQIESLEVLPCRVDDLTRLRCGQGIDQRLETAAAQGVDAPDAAAGTELQQTEPGEEGPLTQEFGIDTDEGLRFERAGQPR